MMSSYFRIYFLKNKCKERGLDDLKAACFCFCSFVCDGILRCFRIVESWKVVDERKSSWKIELSLLELAVLCCHGGALSRSATRTLHALWDAQGCVFLGSPFDHPKRQEEWVAVSSQKISPLSLAVLVGQRSNLSWFSVGC